MARDTAILRELEGSLKEAGFKFVRQTTGGRRRWAHGSGPNVVVVDLPMKGYERGHMRRNVEVEVRRALRACGKIDRPKKAPKEPRFEYVETTPAVEAQTESAPSVAEEDAPRDEPVVVADERAGGAGDPVPEPEHDAEPPKTDSESTLVAGSALTCDLCGETFERAIYLGRHKFQRHGIRGVSDRAAQQHRAKLAGEILEPAGKLAWREVPKPAETVPSGRGAVLVAGTATMERVAALAEALGAAARELVTEYRLVREENDRLTKAVKQLDEMLEGLRGRR